ncbi:MAG: hypothetical protein GY875_07160 [Gammaproteobacteria bacterium]|nr:hypothetical protein [Gammaproteobacteria bacterium]
MIISRVETFVSKYVTLVRVRTDDGNVSLLVGANSSYSQKTAISYTGSRF